MAIRELDEALGLTELAGLTLADRRTGRNIQHDRVALLRQSVYSWLAGYEDTNDAERLAVDPAMRAVVGRRSEKPAASTNALSRFETQTLSEPDNMEKLTKLNSAWVARTGEQWIKERKCALRWTRLSCHRLVANQVRLALFVLAHNLGNFLRRLALPRNMRHWSLRSIQVKLIKIGAKVIQHAGHITFQMAEVAVSKQLFEQILERIWALAPGAG